MRHTHNMGWGSAIGRVNLCDRTKKIQKRFKKIPKNKGKSQESSAIFQRIFFRRISWPEAAAGLKSQVARLVWQLVARAVAAVAAAAAATTTITTLKNIGNNLVRRVRRQQEQEKGQKQ